MTVSLFTDGSVLVNPDGPGGWAVVVVRDGNAVEQLSGFSESTTNNIMEMTAVIEAIKFMPAGDRFQVISDSQYVVNGINSWMGTWAKRGWAKKGGAIANLELWQMLYTIVEPERMDFKWIRGHDKNTFNEMADELAGKEARRFV
jgi:ribonuclease HI